MIEHTVELGVGELLETVHILVLAGNQLLLELSQVRLRDNHARALPFLSLN